MADDKDKKNNSQNSGQNGFKHEGASVNCSVNSSRTLNETHVCFSADWENPAFKKEQTCPSKKETSFTQTVSTMSAKDKNDNK